MNIARVDFEAFEIKKIPKGRNAYADSLATLALAISSELKRFIPVLCLLGPNIIGEGDKDKN